MGRATSLTTDVDWVVIGSGFGRSVAALRLAQKGYSVRAGIATRTFRHHSLPLLRGYIRAATASDDVGDVL